MERWLSGRKRLIANPLYDIPSYRGFESLSLRLLFKLLLRSSFAFENCQFEKKVLKSIFKRPASHKCSSFLIEGFVGEAAPPDTWCQFLRSKSILSNPSFFRTLFSIFSALLKSARRPASLPARQLKTASMRF